MATKSQQARDRNAWRLAREQHGEIDRGQLLSLGYSAEAIRWRLKVGRLHPTSYRGVYAVGRPELTRKGNWLAAVKSCGARASLTHGSGAAFWDMGNERWGVVEVSVPPGRCPSHPKVRVHRRTAALPQQLFVVSDHIPVTSPALTIIDMAPRLGADGLDAMISRADVLELTNPLELREVAAGLPRIPGAARVRDHLDRQAFRLTRSQLERFFLSLATQLSMRFPGPGPRSTASRSTSGGPSWAW